MIFILDGILGLNLFLAYKFFKNIISPAFLMGAGMMIASIIATLHYETWRMSDFSFLSVLILGGCPFFFTICCKFFSAFFKPNKITHKHNWTISSINFYALEKIYIVFIVIFLLHLIYTYLSMRDCFSSKTLSELLMARRLDFNSHERLFELPFISIQLSFFLNLITILSIWMFYLIRFYISKKKKQHIRIIYYIVTIILFRSIDGLLTGAKGNILPILFYFLFFYFQFHYLKIGKFIIGKKIYNRLIIISIIGILSFSTLNILIGRSVEQFSNYELFSEYCGAEIKNFDILLNRNFKSTNGFGAHTFGGIYKKIHPDVSYEMYRFESVNGYSLGNVYTQFSSFYVDFGIFGSFVMVSLIALVITVIYKKTLVLLLNPIAINWYAIVYCWIMFEIFFCFFAGLFTSNLISPLGIKYAVVSSIILYLFENHIICKSKILA